MLRLEVAEGLRAAGMDIVRASDCGKARADDALVLATAIADGRTLVTVDKHFGDWAVLPLKSHPGVIRLQVHPPISTAILSLLLPFLRGHEQSQFKNHLVILSAKRVRWIRTGD